MKALQTAMVNVQSVMSRNSEYGADDSEPGYHLNEQIRRAVRGDEYRPLDANQWELYTFEMKCGRAARSLNSATKKLVDKLMKAKYTDVQSFLSYYGID